MYLHILHLYIAQRYACSQQFSHKAIKFLHEPKNIWNTTGQVMYENVPAVHIRVYVYVSVLGYLRRSVVNVSPGSTCLYAWFHVCARVELIYICTNTYSSMASICIYFLSHVHNIHRESAAYRHASCVSFHEICSFSCQQNVKILTRVQTQTSLLLLNHLTRYRPPRFAVSSVLCFLFTCANW
jgi:hypothetical protein